jgi:Integrase zinc binding domain
VKDVFKAEELFASAFEQLTKVASNEKLGELKLKKNSNIFEGMAIQRFKELIELSAQGTQRIKIALYDPPEKVREENLIEELIKNFHETPIGGHEGVTRTLKRIRQKYEFDNMKKKITKYK